MFVLHFSCLVSILKLHLYQFQSFSVNQALQLENRKLQSDFDKLKTEDHNKDQKLQKLQ